MNIDAIERTRGVGALVVVSEQPGKGFLAIRELSAKRKTNKLRGSWSLPMETCEPGEDDQQTLDRLFREEVFVHPRIQKGKLCECELNRGVVLHTYLFETAPDGVFSPGTFGHEVNAPQWIGFGEVLSAPEGDLRFRPGVHEVVLSYVDYCEDPFVFSLRRYRCEDLKNQACSRVLSIMEQGFSQTEAVSRLGLYLPPSIGIPASTR